MEKININYETDLGIFYDQIAMYGKQYINAIIILLNKKQIEKYLLPLVNLTYQYIENNLESIILNSLDVQKTPKELEITTHNLDELIKKIKKKYEKYKGEMFFDSIINTIEEYLKYLKNIFGKKILINSRYPINNNELKINFNNNHIIDEEKFDFNLRKAIMALVDLQTFYMLDFVYYKDFIEDVNGEKNMFEFIKIMNKRVEKEDERRLYKSILMKIHKKYLESLVKNI